MEVETITGKSSASPIHGSLPELTRIYLVRHGRTSLNAAGVLRGHLDPALDDLGRLQAAWLGAALGRRGAQVVVASPLRRAVETGQAIASSSGVEIETDPRLIDRDYGGCAGQSKEALEARWGSVDDAPDVEPLPEVRARAWEALTDIAQRARGATAVVVSHDVVNRLLLVTLDPGLGDYHRLPQETGCFNTLECRAARWTVRSVNEICVEPVSSPISSELGTEARSSPRPPQGPPA